MNPCITSLHVWVSHLPRADKVFPVSMCGQGFPVSRSTIWQNCSQGNFKVGTVARESTRVGVSHLRADQVSQRSKSDSQNRLQQGGSSPRMTVREEGGGNLFSRQPAPPHWAAPACTPTHSSLSHTTCTCMCPSNPSLLTDRTSLKVTFCFFYFPQT